MKRRGFLATLAAAVISVTAARKLGAEALEEAPPPEDPYAGLTFIEDPFPARGHIVDGMLVVAPAFKEMGGGLLTPNPDWVNAPVEVEFWSTADVSAATRTIKAFVKERESGSVPADYVLRRPDY